MDMHSELAIFFKERNVFLMHLERSWICVVQVSFFTWMTRTICSKEC